MTGTGDHDAPVAAGQGTNAAGGQAIADLQVLRDALHDLLDAAGVGSLLASVAHAGNNRLTVILSCLDLLAGADVGDEDRRSAIALATGAAQQLADEFGSLLAGARRNAPPLEPVDLEWALRRVVVLDSFLHGGSLVTAYEAAPGLEVDVERERLVATLLRLCTLARRRGARSIRIGAATLDVGARTIDRPSLRKGRYCRIGFEVVGAESLGGSDELEYAAVEAFVAALRGHVATTPGLGSTVIELCLPAGTRIA